MQANPQAKHPHLHCFFWSIFLLLCCCRQ